MKPEKKKEPKKGECGTGSKDKSKDKKKKRGME
jgi:hypothetical protein